MLHVLPPPRILRKQLALALGMVAFISQLAYAGERDTLRPFDRRTAGIYYRNPGVKAQAARFDLQAPAYLRKLVVTLSGPSLGSARLTVYSNEAGLPAPILSRSIGKSYRLEKSQAGLQRVAVDLADLFLDEPQFFVVVDELSAGVVLISDQTRKQSRCSEAGAVDAPGGQNG